MLKTLKSKTRQGGFSLVELVVVLAILGALAGAVVLAVKPMMYKNQLRVTDKSMDKVSKALANYVERHNRLPCPADPNPTGGETLGMERDATGSNGYGDCATQPEGIVPFRALGLKQDDVRDGFGYMLSYHITPVFAAHKGVVGQNYLDEVHEACRTADWVKADEGFDAGDANGSQPKFVRQLQGDVEMKIEVTGGRKVTWGGHGLAATAGDASKIDAGEYIWFQFNYPHYPDSVEAEVEGLGVGDRLRIRIFGNDGSDVTFGRTIDTDMINDKGNAVLDIKADDGSPSSTAIRSFKLYHKSGQPGFTVVNVDDSGVDVKNINPPKARFCCPTVAGHTQYDPSYDLQILDENDHPVVLDIRSDNSADYDHKDTLAGSVDSNAIGLSYALVSHGLNGHGAYLVNGTDQRRQAPYFGDMEEENIDGNNILRHAQMARRKGNPSYYDDILMWRTQEQIYAELSSGSCVRP